MTDDSKLTALVVQLVPLPGGLDDGFQFGEIGTPAEGAADSGGIADQAGGIAGAPFTQDSRYGTVGNSAGSVDDLFDGKTLAVAKIIGG